jgi:regulator of protease activity HflC (stomatin/prohibitin superfamily)
MERNTQKHGLINLVILVLVGAAALAVASYGKTQAGLISVMFMGLGALVAAVSWFQMGLEERERVEKLEFDELSRSAAGSAIFTASETEVFPAQRSREQFERFFVPAFTILLCLLEFGVAFLLWRWMHRPGAANVIIQQQSQLVIMGLFGMFFLVLFLIGRFSATLARLENLRLLRPGATSILLSAYLCLLVGLGIIPELAGITRFDRYLALSLICLMVLIGIETLINLVFELYRPRIKGKVGRPMYESRMISLLGQPEGIFRTAAHTLDYQFGFKVSETWAYRLFVRWLPWMFVGQGAALLLSTTVVFVEPGEQAVLEHCGRFVRVLEPGGHFKLPWPVDQIHRFPTKRIQTLDVGFTPEIGPPKQGQTVLWTVQHTREENFVVADPAAISVRPDATNSSTRRQLPPVNVLTVSIPVQYQITNIVSWLYNNEEPEVLLQSLATRQVVLYLVSVDFQDIMTRGLARATQVLQDKIQAEADRHNLGAHIVFVGLQDIHPPVSVAPEFEKVVAATHTAEATILDAQSYQIVANSLAEVQAYKILSEARADAWRQKVDAEARASLFTNQLPAYLASPSVYTNRAYWEMYAQAATNVRKYILLVTNTHDIVVLNLEDKVSEEYLGGLSVAPPPSQTSTNKKN